MKDSETINIGGNEIFSFREICEIIGPSLKEKGLLFVGIDVIGNYLTEINVTSPTGIQELSRFEDTNIASLIWDAIEKKL